MTIPFVEKLGHFVRFSEADKALLLRAIGEHVRHVEPHEDIAREGDRPVSVKVVLRGWACRYRTLEDGRRQIVALFLPGDLCDLNVLLFAELDHCIRGLTTVEVAELPPGVLEGLLAHPRIGQALRWDAAVAAAIQREWTVSLGQRDALERMSHLFCEIFVRLAAAGLTSGDSCAFPLTQVELANVTGLSAVHVNRTLQELRALNLIVLKDRTLTIPDLARLQAMAMFDPGYLHLDHEGRHLDAIA